MNIKKRVAPPADDRKLSEFHIPGRSNLVPGTEVSLEGKRGRYRFQYAEKSIHEGRPTVLTFVGGRLDGQGEKFVAVYPWRVKTVHRTSKTLVNITKEKGKK
ncbi:hypothetical protein J4U02_gp124 [Mycobacterium phage Aziz]|uniref:DUF7246 domain-containing protein n=2 Tax=Reyvirus TaxID=1623301 RepID=A0A1L6BYR2_9CAUD|nr:hypothetical protein J4U02_gp124 [Mycobacterium phage Aziz]YP_010014039.1 hypothetical protein J4U04_gp126 [Mycobacterium phage MrMagoo]ARM70305.1 hypothetical protein SEA_GARDENSALSA_152 [Mycobacterium phage GardenSalsa]ASR75975.1 hypothetical protein SEA_GENEVAB15_153 [Mycobacterium phage GenevaB15]APQ42236.1 hypothetical protein PBI_MRMAGOO_154 [Mycobacterium phage MrMagoo]QNJ56788.1 hypothetical protein SEA_AZIZ_150 [Mycobacterium phage Aziz]